MTGARLPSAEAATSGGATAAAGAVAGAAGGNAIQNRVTGDSYDVHVRLDDGRTVVVNQRDVGGLRANTYVRVVNGKVVLR